MNKTNVSPVAMKVRCFLSMMIVCIICGNTAMATLLEDTQRVIGERGVFTVTVNNNGNRDINTCIGVDLTLHPEGYGTDKLGDSGMISIKAHLFATIVLLKPLVGNFPNYKGIGPQLLADSEVMVYFGPRVMGNVAFYPAQYISGTKIIEVPNITFDIDANGHITNNAFAQKILKNEHDLIANFAQSSDISTTSNSQQE